MDDVNNKKKIISRISKSIEFITFQLYNFYAADVLADGLYEKKTTKLEFIWRHYGNHSSQGTYVLALNETIT